MPQSLLFPEAAVLCAWVRGKTFRLNQRADSVRVKPGLSKHYNACSPILVEDNGITAEILDFILQQSYIT